MKCLTRVLCVDDERPFLEIAQRYLEKLGDFEVETADSVEGAVSMMAEARFDAIVSDYQMPEADGLDLLKRVRGSGDNIAFILLTGRGREDVAIDALNSGADFYIQKGLDPRSQFHELANMIRQAVHSNQVERELRQSEERYRSLAESSTDFIIVLGKDGRVEYVNKCLLDTMGLELDQAIGRDLSELMPEEMVDGVKSMHSLALSGGEPMTMGPRKYSDEGGEIWLTTSLVPLKDEDGSVRSIMSISRDVSDIMRVSEDAARERDRVQKYLDASSLLVAVLSSDKLLMMVNESGSALLGYSKEELIGRDCFSLILPESHREEVAQFLENLIEKRLPGRTEREFPVMTRSGELRFMKMNVSLLLDEAGEVDAVICCGEDLTEQRTKEERFRLLAEHAKDVVVRLALKPKLEIEYSSPSIEVMTGYRIEDFYEDVELLFRIIHPDDRGVILGLVESPETVAGPVAMRIFHKDGTLKWMELQVTPVRGIDGEIVLVETVARDITERMRYEEALRQVNKKLNLLSSVTRHDVLNQLSVMVGWLQIAMQGEKDAEVREHMGKSMEAANTMRSQLEFTGDYKRIGMRRPTWLDLEEAFTRGTGGVAMDGLLVTTDIDGLEVFCDAMLERVFHNLVVNTVRHSGGAKHASLKHRFEDDSLVIVYEDDGKGIPEKEKEMIFERGYGVGTGYGLYLAREILSMTGSGIRETGVEGKGVRFEISVPKGNFRRRKE